MPSIDEYLINNDHIRLVLQGPPGSGKSTLASQFPKPHFFDIDVNLGGTLRYIYEEREKGNMLNLPVSYDHIDRDEKGMKILLPKQYDRLADRLEKVGVDPAIETIVFDSGTTLMDVMIADVLRQQQKSEMSKREWGYFAQLSRKFFATLANFRKHIVLVVHEKAQKDDKGNIILPYKVNWPGQSGENIGAFFTNVWRTELTSTPDGPGKYKYKRIVHTMPSSKYELKNTLGLPPSFEFSWKLIQERLSVKPTTKSV